MLNRNAGHCSIIVSDIAKRVLIDPLGLDVNELYIISGYAAPTILFWYMKNLYNKTQSPIKMSLMVGMIPFDGISASVHEGFAQLLRDEKPQDVNVNEFLYH